ncbi:MAG: HAD family hydrolase [Sandaracinaceae bacterium]
MTAVIFDLDGTLVDSLDDITASLAHTFAAEGWTPLDRTAVERHVGFGARALVAGAVNDVAPEASAEVDRVLALYQARYASHLVDHSLPFEGVAEMLEALNARGVPIAVLSNKPHAMTRQVVEALLPYPFVEVFGARDDVPPKPNPTLALELLRLLGQPARDVYFVGDTPVDIETAARADMNSVAVTWGMREPAVLEGADHRIDHPSALLALIGA